MTAFLYEIILHLKLSIRSKELLVHFYIVPFIFYVFIGKIFTSIDPNSYKTIAAVMTVFAVTMGGVLGSPYPLVEFYGSENKKAYQVGHIPLWTMAVGNCICVFFHLFLVSMIIFATAPFLFDAPIPSNLTEYFITLILLIIASLCIGMLFGLFFQNASQMGMIGQLVFLPSIMLSGIMFPITMLPNALQKIGNIFPATWGFRSMCDDTLILGHIAPLLFVIVIASLISAWKLKRIYTQ